MRQQSNCVWLLLLLAGCTATPPEGSAASEVAHLRAEVAELGGQVGLLSQRVRRLEAAEAAAATERDADAGVPAASELPAAPQQGSERSAEVTLSFVVEPVDAVVRIDDVPLPGFEVRRAASQGQVRVTVERPGFRSVQQSVGLSRSRVLRYRLMRGRGVTRLGGLRGAGRP